MIETKYIITDKNLPILFTEGQLHSDFKMFNPISAGFVKISPRKYIDESRIPRTKIIVEVYGGSDSLGLESRPEDAVLINKLMLQ